MSLSFCPNASGMRMLVSATVRLLIVLATVLVFGAVSGSTRLAQAQNQAAPPAAPEAAPVALKLPPPEELVLTSGLHATFFAAPEAMNEKDAKKVDRKNAVPVILVHDFKGSHGDFADLAQTLQKLGHAVMVPDMRGHGQSTKIINPQTGKPVEVKPDTLKKTDLDAMVRVDMEALKSNLRERNNKGELNIDKLCVVGVGDMGSVIAINWAALDWSWQTLSTGKQGQDVKALVLISPEWNFKGMLINQALDFQPVTKDLSLLIIAGKQNNASMGAATRLHARFEKFHPAPLPDEVKEKQDLFFFTPKTTLAGTKLLGEKALNLAKPISQFIEWRLVNQPYPWTERKDPL